MAHPSSMANLQVCIQQGLQLYTLDHVITCNAIGGLQNVFSTPFYGFSKVYPLNQIVNSAVLLCMWEDMLNFEDGKAP